jgi:hypothetical protein
MLESSSERLQCKGLVGISDVRCVRRKQRAEHHGACFDYEKIIPPAGITLWLFTRDGISSGLLANETLAGENLGDRWNLIGPRPTPVWALRMSYITLRQKRTEGPCLKGSITSHEKGCGDCSDKDQ